MFELIKTALVGQLTNHTTINTIKLEQDIVPIVRNIYIAIRFYKKKQSIVIVMPIKLYVIPNFMSIRTLEVN